MDKPKNGNQRYWMLAMPVSDYQILKRLAGKARCKPMQYLTYLIRAIDDRNRAGKRIPRPELRL